MTHIPILASFTLSLAQSVVLLIALALVAIGISVWVYRKTVPEVTPLRRWTLTALRAIGLMLLLFILFEPVLNLEDTVTIQPKIAVVFDNSKSMTVEDQGGVRSVEMQRVAGSNAIDALKDEGTRFYTMSGKAYPLQDFSVDSLDFTGPETDITAALQKAHDDLNEDNLSAVVIATDGSFTSGKNPLYTAEALGVPVFTIGIGDSTAKRDVLVSRVLANSIAYVENTLPIETSIRSVGYNGETVTVTLTEGSNTIGSSEVTLQEGSNEYPVRFEYTPESEGSKKLTVRVSALDGELTAKNNSRSFFIKVLKTKMQVALVAGAPSADVSVFRQVLGADENIELTTYIQKTRSAWYDPQPTEKALEDADCIVLIGYPIIGGETRVLSMVKAQVEKNRAPLFLLLSRQTNLGALASTLDTYFPLQVLQTRQNETEVYVTPQDESRMHPVLSTGIPYEVWNSLPPLVKTESSFKPRAGASALATMTINTVQFNEPVLVARNLNRRKVIAMTAYQLIRWQLADDVLDGNVPERLLSNAVRWLTARDDEKQVRIRPVKEFFDSGEPIEFQGQVYDESYQPVDNASVEVRVQTGDGERELLLNAIGNGFYTGSIEQLNEGDYTFNASASLDGTELGKDRGRFSVGEQNIEFIDTRMNANLLRQIAQKTGGRYFSSNDLSGLPEALRAAPQYEPEDTIIKSDIQLWNLIWMLGAAILAFAIEWFLRKQSGMI